MKKLWLLPLVLIILFSLIFTGCGEKTTTTSTPKPTTSAPAPGTTNSAPAPGTTTSAPAPGTTTSAPPTAEGTYGGTLRIIYNAAPRILGGSVEQGPFDLFVLLGGVEKIMEYNDKAEIVPWLAESAVNDDKTQTITVKLRPNIKCHDGSPFDADALVWNFNNQVGFKRIGYINQFVSITAKDKTTAVIQYQGGYNNQLLLAWLWSPPMWSKGAWEAQGSNDAAMQWARDHFSATGPFKLEQYRRDVDLTLTRFDDYWGPKPYLDKVKWIFIPDTVTATAMMMAGEADMWIGAPVNDQLSLVKQGLIMTSGGGTVPGIQPNNAAEGSKWKDKRLLMAIDYALDKKAIAQALGQGRYTAMTMSVPQGAVGFDPSFQPRNYDPQKAKDLLTEAGYPNGFKVKLTVLQGNTDLAEAIKRYLDDVGMIVDIDIADAGRFYGGIFVAGWDDLLLYSGGFASGDMLANFQNNWGDQPLTHMAASSYAIPPELLELSQQSRTYASVADKNAATVKIFRWIADNAFVIPIYLIPGSYVAQPWVHTTYLTEGGFTFYFGKYWMEKH
jgi:peptide/nickel transport system substrate-binding protein